MKTLLLLCAVLFCACHETKEEYVEHLTKKWQGKEVKFPENPIFTRFINDTVDYQTSATRYKIVIYVDSMGCMSCKLQLPRWKEFMAQVDSVCNKHIPFLFFSQIENKKELSYNMERDKFTLPVCIDTEDRFNKLNNFPSEMMFQTFLLDKDNKVIVIGNPIHNLKERNLYLQKIAGITINKLSETFIATDQEEYDMGIVGKEETKAQQVILRNNGTEIFKLKGITTSCECTTTEQDWEEIAPGETATLTVYYKAEQPGDFYRTVTIYGNVRGNRSLCRWWGRLNEKTMNMSSSKICVLLIQEVFLHRSRKRGSCSFDETRNPDKLATPRIPSYINNIIGKEETAPQRYEKVLKTERYRVTRRARNLTDRESVGEEAHKSIINNKFKKKEYEKDHIISGCCCNSGYRWVELPAKSE